MTAYDMAVGESEPRYIKGLYLTHRPEVERGWDPQSSNVVMDDREWFTPCHRQKLKIKKIK